MSEVDEDVREIVAHLVCLAEVNQAVISITESSPRPTPPRKRLTPMERLMRAKEKADRLAAKEAERVAKEAKRVAREAEWELKRKEKEEAKRLADDDRRQKEEAKRLLREQEEEEKTKRKQEREEKEEVRRLEKEEKKRESEKKSEELAIKRREREADESERAEKRRRVEEDKEKQASILRQFFVVKKPAPAAERQRSENYRYMPPPLQPNQYMARLIQHELNDKEKETLTQGFHQQATTTLYLSELKHRTPRSNPNRTTPQPDIMVVSEEPRQRPKLLQFREDDRPPYWGTWRRRSSQVNGRRPFGQYTEFDYEYDSEAEWEEEEPGESVGCSGDEGEQQQVDSDDEEEDDGFCVPHGYLSEDEGCSSEEEGAEGNVEKKTSRQQVAAYDLKKLKPLKAIVVQPRFEGDENVVPCPVDLSAFAAVLFSEIEPEQKSPKDSNDQAVPSSESLTTEKENEGTPTLQYTKLKKLGERKEAKAKTSGGLFEKHINVTENPIVIE